MVDISSTIHVPTFIRINLELAMEEIGGMKTTSTSIEQDEDAAATSTPRQFPLSPSAKQTIAPLTSHREASPSVSPTRYNLRFVTSSPGTSSPHARTSAAGADGVDEDDSLRGESIAFDLRGLTTQSPNGSPIKSQRSPSCASASPSYVIRRRNVANSASESMLSPGSGRVSKFRGAESSPSSSEGGQDEPAVTFRASSSKHNAASVISFRAPQEPGSKTDPFAGAPAVPPLTPIGDAVELTPTVEAAVKASRMAGEQKKRMVDPFRRAIGR